MISRCGYMLTGSPSMSRRFLRLDFMMVRTVASCSGLIERGEAVPLSSSSLHNIPNNMANDYSMSLDWSGAGTHHSTAQHSTVVNIGIETYCNDLALSRARSLLPVSELASNGTNF